MKTILFLAGAGLLSLTFSDVALAASITPFPGEVINFSGTAIQTSGSNCCGSGTVAGSITLGSMVANTTDWTVPAFTFVPVNLGSARGTPSFNVQFDASNATVIGTFTQPYTGNGGDSRLLTVTFIDGNSTSDPYTDQDLTDPTNGRAGTVSYTASVAAVPEPSSGWLFGSLLALGAARRIRASRLRA